MKLSRTFQILLVVFLSLGLYYPLLFAPLNSLDDVQMVNEILNSGEVSFLQLLLPNASGHYYRPLVYYTFILDQPFWGLQASFMHLENVLWHTLNAVLVFLVAGKALGRYRLPQGGALAAALIFALHPINTEAVNWISGRTDLMAATFVLAALWALLQALETGRALWAMAGAFALLLGTLCKETALFFLPGALLVAVFWESQRGAPLRTLVQRFRARLAFFVPFVFSAVVYLALRHAALSQADHGTAMATGQVAGAVANPQTTLNDIVKALGFYIKKLFLPWPLNFAIIHVPEPYLVPGLLVLACCCYLLWRRDLVAAFFLISLSVLSPAFLVLITRMAWTPIAERYLYIPCAAFSIAVVLACQLAVQRWGGQKTLALLSLPLFAGAAWGTCQRNLVWQDNLALFDDAVRQTPDFAPARNELAGALIQHGRIAEGRSMLKKNRAEGSVKNWHLTVLNAAGAMSAEGDLEGARSLLTESLDPKSPNYGAFLKQLVGVDRKRLAEATDPAKVRQIRRELILNLDTLARLTGESTAWYQSGQVRLAAGERAEAAAAFERAYQTAPPGAAHRLPAKKLAESLTASR